MKSNLRHKRTFSYCICFLPCLQHSNQQRVNHASCSNICSTFCKKRTICRAMSKYLYGALDCVQIYFSNIICNFS